MASKSRGVMQRMSSGTMSQAELKKHMQETNAGSMDSDRMMALKQAMRRTKAREAVMGMDSEMGMDEKLAYEHVAEMDRMKDKEMGMMKDEKMNETMMMKHKKKMKGM